ncbi:MAG: ribosome biogenesis factor YjgA [Gammaproteobacteria bacterium]|nr:MAG: ribosome biogenesis factor YjgA [Gammaproteobacteria bacterium]
MNDEVDPEHAPPSKSRLKRDAHDLQQLGTRLVDLPESVWSMLGLPDSLVAALREAGHLHARGGRKRQLQFIGKLMRDVDPEPILNYFEQERLRTRKLAQAHHKLEAWRDRLIEEGNPAVEIFLEHYAQADRQHLRQLVRQAKKELAHNTPPKSSRALFRYIRDLE